MVQGFPEQLKIELSLVKKTRYGCVEGYLETSLIQHLYNLTFTLIRPSDVVQWPCIRNT